MRLPLFTPLALSKSLYTPEARRRLGNWAAERSSKTSVCLRSLGGVVRGDLAEVVCTEREVVIRTVPEHRPAPDAYRALIDNSGFVQSAGKLRGYFFRLQIPGIF
jgi:hypothetical protein